METMTGSGKEMIAGSTVETMTGSTKEMIAGSTAETMTGSAEDSRQYSGYDDRQWKGDDCFNKSYE